MIVNFLKVAFRNMKKYKGYSFINIVGLAVGMCCVMLIFLFVRDELSYEKFYPQSKQIYRVATLGKMGDKIFDSSINCAPLAPTMVSEFPEVKKAVRLHFWENVLVTYNQKQFLEDRVLRTDSTFFEIFSRPFIYGNSTTALKGIRKVVLTKSAAHKYFADENPVGKMLQMGTQTLYTVTGVVEDVPPNSHFHYDMVIPIELSHEAEENWFSSYLQVYILLESGTDKKQVEGKFRDFIVRHMGPRLKEALGVDLEAWEEQGNEYTFYLEPLEKIYLYSTTDDQLEPISDINIVVLFSGIAFFILLLACVNFLNLTTARSYTRAREVGVRKVFGGSRGGLISQFFSEILFLTVLAGFLSCFLVELLMPLFNQISRKNLNSSLLFEPQSLLFMIAMIAVVVIIAGSYTAFSLSGYSIQQVLRGEVRTGQLGKRIRAALVVFQFAVAVGILISAFVIELQINFMHEKKLGFDKEAVLVVDRSEVMDVSQGETFIDNLKKFSGIQSASFSWHIPGRGTNGWSMYAEGGSPEDLIQLKIFHCDENFLDVMKIKLTDGRFFDPNRQNDTARIVINKAAAKALGYNKPVGRNVYRPEFRPEFEGNRVPMEIIGVVEDFHFSSMRDEIEPAIFWMNGHETKRYLLIRLNPESTVEALEYVKSQWDSMTQGQPFEYFFLDNDFDSLFKGEMRTASILSAFTILAFVIALLGLMGLVSFEMQQRVKEIGIRKVMGSSSYQLVFLLSKSLCTSVTLGNLIAWPVAWWAMYNWLNHFVYRVQFPYYYFLIALIISLVMALIIVITHTLKASWTNPVDALKYE